MLFRLRFAGRCPRGMLGRMIPSGVGVTAYLLWMMCKIFSKSVQWENKTNLVKSQRLNWTSKNYPLRTYGPSSRIPPLRDVPFAQHSLAAFFQRFPRNLSSTSLSEPRKIQENEQRKQEETGCHYRWLVLDNWARPLSYRYTTHHVWEPISLTQDGRQRSGLVEVRTAKLVTPIHFCNPRALEKMGQPKKPDSWGSYACDVHCNYIDSPK